MSYVKCPRCGLRLRLLAPWMVLRPCPRCLVKEQVKVEMLEPQADAPATAVAQGRPGGEEGREREL